jgi:hypothetical protein
MLLQYYGDILADLEMTDDAGDIRREELVGSDTEGQK